MFKTETSRLRDLLLNLHGVGPETADAILLYAGGHPSFVVDAYTMRVLRRHFLFDGKADYETVKRAVEQACGGDIRIYQEYHALFVEVGKRFCRPRARCGECPLRKWDHDESL